MRTRTRFLDTLPIALAVALAAAGCRKPAAKAWSCDNRERHACSEWSTAGMDPEMTSKQQASCVGMGGTVVQAACTDAEAIGSCTAAGGEAGSRIVYYAPRQVSDARRACEMLGGSWK